MEKVTRRKVTLTLNKLNLAPESRDQIMVKLFPELALNRPVRLSRLIMTKIKQELQKSGKCGIQLTDSGRIYVVTGKHIKMTNFNFQRPEVLQKALANRYGV